MLISNSIHIPLILIYLACRRSIEGRVFEREKKKRKMKILQALQEKAYMSYPYLCVTVLLGLSPNLKLIRDQEKSQT